MAFNARVFRILIASPSDVSDEREIAVRTIQAWNDLNSAERQLVLLPLRWETHSAPEYGRRPQEVINRQVVDHCDLLVGVFWTRIGSPTGAAESGTLEEIERVATQGKPVMLYFSQAKQDPDRIEIEQLQRLREFKKKTFPKALVETYTSQIEFRDKLAKQLEIQLRTLLTEENKSADEISATPSTEIQFEFADPKTGKRIGSELELQTNFIELEEHEKLPDYEKPGRVKPDNSSLIWDSPNKDYYRDMAVYLQRNNFFRPIRFWLKNVGSLGARDVYVDIRITSERSRLIVESLASAGLRAPDETTSFAYSGGRWSTTEDAPEQLGNQWTTKFELSALQPQREVSPPPAIVVGAKESGDVDITARIYADTLSEPIVRNLRVRWTVNGTKKTSRELLEESGVKVQMPPLREVSTTGA